MNLIRPLSLIFNVAQLAAAQWNPDAEWGSGWSSGPGCSDVITSSTALQSDLSCDCSQGPALTIQGSRTVFDLNGHFVSCQDASSGSFDPLARIGIRVEGKSNSIVGPGNVTESLTGILLDGEGGHTISRVSVYDIGNDGIRVLSDANAIDQSSVELTEEDGVHILSDRNSLTNSEITNSGDDLIDIDGSFNLVEGNRIDYTTDSGYYGVYVRQFRNHIIRNVISRTHESGMELKGGGGGHEVRGNEFFEIGRDGSFAIIINAANDGVHIVENHIYGGFYSGISVSGTPASKSVVVERNIVNSNSGDGVNCVHCLNCHFKGNIINGNLGSGIIYGNACDDSVLIDNVVTKNANYGVRIFANADNVVVTRNTVWGNAVAELDDQSGTTIVVGDNTIEP